jgi:hypothetical protein
VSFKVQKVSFKGQKVSFKNPQTLVYQRFFEFFHAKDKKEKVIIGKSIKRKLPMLTFFQNIKICKLLLHQSKLLLHFSKLSATKTVEKQGFLLPLMKK